MYRGAVNLFYLDTRIFWKCTIWNINIQYKNDWYTLQKWTKQIFAFRHWDNLVSSSIYPSCYLWKEFKKKRNKGQCLAFYSLFSSNVEGIFLKASQLLTMCVSLLMLYRNNFKFMQSYTHKFFSNLDKGQCNVVQLQCAGGGFHFIIEQCRWLDMAS